MARILCWVVPIVVAGMAVHWHLERKLLERQFDESLAEKAMTLATLVTQAEGELELEFADEFMPQYSRAEQPFFFEVWYPDGRSLERSYSLQGEGLPFEHGPLTAPATFETTLASGVELRCVGIEFPARLASDAGATAGASVVIAVGTERTRLQETLRLGYAQVALTGIVSVTGISIFVLLALKRGVHLLRRIVSEVEQITPGSLEEPLDERLVPEEIRPIVASLNSSLETIRGFVERERRFTADVAHELRTPIAELRAAAEVALRWPADESWQRLGADARAIALQMGSLVESLLELASLESDGVHGQLEPVDLAKLVGSLVDQVERGPDGQEIVLDAQPTLTIVSRSKLWEIAVRNLLDNARDYSSPGSRIRVLLRRDGDGVRLCVSNPTDSLDREGALLCTQRLWRANRDPQETKHFGLGLSIVQAACAQVGHRFTVRLQEGVFHALVWKTVEGPIDGC